MAEIVDILAAGVIDSNGDPLDSGLAYFYQVGTTTKVSVFSDGDATQTTSNPVTLDTTGKAEVYIEQAARLVIFTPAGVMVADLDSVGSIGGSTAGDATIGINSNNVLTLNAKVEGDILPTLDEIYDIGSSVLRWAEGHFQDLTVYENLLVGVGQVDCDIVVDATTGDPGLKLRANGLDANAWRVFLDNSDSDKLNIAYNGTSALVLNSTGDLNIEGNNSGHVQFLVRQKGSGDAEIILRVNDSTSNQWVINIDNSDSDNLTYDYGSTTCFKMRSGSVPMNLDAGNVGASATPDKNTLYCNLIPKAWSSTASDGTINDGVNLTCSKGAAGIYDYSFKTNMASANYAATATGETGALTIAIVLNKANSGFRVITRPSGAGDTDEPHSVNVIGDQT